MLFRSQFDLQQEKVNDEPLEVPVVAPPSQPVPYAAEFTSTEKIYDKDFSDVVGIEQYVKEKKREKQEAESTVVDTSPYENYEAPNLDVNPEKDLPLYQYYATRSNEKLNDTFTLCSGKDDNLSPAQRREKEEKARLEQERIQYTQCKYRGVLFNTYLMYELEDDVYMIDQHAAHERLIYDAYRAKFGERRLAKQSLLVPHIFVVNPEEKQFIEDNMKVIWQMGFSVEPFGSNSYRVNEIPADLPNLDAKTFFDDFLANIHELKSITLVDMLKDKIAQSACKAAIKGGDVLTEQERDELFAMIKGNVGLKCPHGRPVCVKLTKYEIEKMFKRKV